MNKITTETTTQSDVYKVCYTFRTIKRTLADHIWNTLATLVQLADPTSVNEKYKSRQVCG